MFPGAEGSESIEEAAAETMGGAGGGLAVGTLDIFLLTVSVGVGVYWFFFRKTDKTDSTDGIVNPITSSSMPMTTGSHSGFIQKMKASGRNVVVFYGSQTGTGEEFASRLAKDAQRYGLKGMVADPEENDMEDLSQLADIENSLAIFCMATYGEGDPTDNAQEFYDWLQEGNGDLTGVKFAVFGLGNKTYEHYNAMGKYIDKRLEELGAERIFELGLGDDDQNIEEDFVTWRDQFWPAVCECYGLEATGDESSIRNYAVTEYPSEELPEKVFEGEVARFGSFKNQKAPYDAKNPFLAAVRVNRELHKSGERSCMHIEFDISGSRIRYESGDHVAVYPINDSELVESIGRLVGASLDTVFTLKNLDEEASKKHPFPCPTTYRTAFSHYLDITSHPRTNVLKELSEYASDPEEKAKLVLMSSATPEGKKEYSDWIMKSHRNIVAVLEDLPSVKLPLDHLCELLPRLQARYYSISSSPKVTPERISITAVLIEYSTPTGRTAKGVATTYLKDKLPNGPENCPTVPIYVRKSQFRLPFKTTTPVIMVGPGTGLAPFRGFIQERDFFRKDETKKVGDTILFFGCRNSKEDFIYEEELNEYKANGTLTEMHVAFSREGPQKVYVQHLMRNCKQKIWEMLEKGSHIYVCGDARHMAPDVQRTIREIIIEEGGRSEKEAEDYIKRMQTKGRYACDVWS